MEDVPLLVPLPLRRIENKPGWCGPLPIEETNHGRYRDPRPICFFDDVEILWRHVAVLQTQQHALSASQGCKAVAMDLT